MEKYWKWVLMRHNSSFAEYYGVEEARIPWQWNSYEKEDILKDIEFHYHIQIDRLTSKIKRRAPPELTGYRY